MESILQLCESRDGRYPDHFEAFLSNCIENHPTNFLENDYLFAAVYFIILECGFCPLTSNDTIMKFCSDSFNIKILRSVKSYSSDHMKLIKTDVGEYWVYGIQLKLGNYRCICELQGVPSAENNSYLIINFISKQLGLVKSLCLSTVNFTEKNDYISHHLVRLKNLQGLTLMLKDKISNIAKEVIMLSEGQGCYPHLLRLPEEIQKKIIYGLIEDSTDVQNLALTCSYLYNIITNDDKIWEALCTAEFDGKILNETLHYMLQLNDDGNGNIFRKVFLRLKKENLKKPYYSCESFFEDD